MNRIISYDVLYKIDLYILMNFIKEIIDVNYFHG